MIGSMSGGRVLLMAGGSPEDTHHQANENGKERKKLQDKRQQIPIFESDLCFDLSFSVFFQIFLPLFSF